jgi:Baseplate J-like protein
MPLALPNLDDRRWAELIEEGRALIPFYAPEWTDHNVHDPGMTVIDLLAWLVEMDLYQLNQIPERHKLKFLALVGIRPEPPRPARTVLTLTPRAGVSPRLPATVEFEGVDPFGLPTRFRTLDDLKVVSVTLEAIQLKDHMGFHDLTVRWRRSESINLLGDDPRPGAELYLGFSHALPSGICVSLFFTVLAFDASEAERTRLIEEAKQQRAACRTPDWLGTCDTERQPAVEEDAAGTPPHHAVRTLWEYFAGPGTWRRLEPTAGHIVDDTRAFTLNGRVTVKLEAEMAPERLGQVAQEYYYLRCRLVSGAYDATPKLHNLVVNGVLVEQAVPAGMLTWVIAQDAIVTGVAPARGELASFRVQFTAGQISHLTFIGSGAEQGPDAGLPKFSVLEYRKDSGEHPDILSIEAEFLGDGTGAPLQQLTMPAKPVQHASFRLFTIEQGEWCEWSLRPDFDASGRDDAHFLLDATNGTVSFGDGERGRVPPQQAQIIATYDATRAETGNLAAGKITCLALSPHNQAIPDFDCEKVKDQLSQITNPLPAMGGLAAETFTHAAGRAFEAVEAPQRAVTLADYEALARQAPGVRLARVAKRANLHPSFPCFKALGMVTLIILPYLPADRPMPSRGLREAVASYLSRRRVIGTRLEVIEPSYSVVAVRADVRSHLGANPSEVRRRIVAALNQFFHPLTGGPDGSGWPFGRDVYRSEVMQVLDETPGVDHVLSLELLVDEGTPQCGNICLGPIGLVAAGQHEIQVR